MNLLMPKTSFVFHCGYVFAVISWAVFKCRARAMEIINTMILKSPSMGHGVKFTCSSLNFLFKMFVS